MEEANEQNIEHLFNELIELSENIDVEEEISRIAQQSQVELKYVEMMPIFDEYYGGVVLSSLTQTKGAKKRLRDPKGGLTAAGRAYFKRKEGANLKPGVKGPANTPEKMRRKGSFLTRFFTNPSGPMVDEKGRATRLALSAAAWGEPVPKNREDAAKLAAKGRRLLERYQNTKKKAAEPGILSKAVFSPRNETQILCDGPEMKGLGVITVFDSFETFGLREEVESRREIKRLLAKMAPAFVEKEKMFVDDQNAMSRMGKASKQMAKKRARRS